uniref:Uncharacterized protein n=1 Tax=Arundo donax TaxID=35708 RepID=A0A0A8ZKM8_ARUDO
MQRTTPKPSRGIPKSSCLMSDAEVTSPPVPELLILSAPGGKFLHSFDRSGSARFV